AAVKGLGGIQVTYVQLDHQDCPRETRNRSRYRRAGARESVYRQRRRSSARCQGLFGGSRWPRRAGLIVRGTTSERQRQQQGDGWDAASHDGRKRHNTNTSEVRRPVLHATGSEQILLFLDSCQERPGATPSSPGATAALSCGTYDSAG